MRWIYLKIFTGSIINWKKRIKYNKTMRLISCMEKSYMFKRILTEHSQYFLLKWRFLFQYRTFWQELWFLREDNRYKLQYEFSPSNSENVTRCVDAIVDHIHRYINPFDQNKTCTLRNKKTCYLKESPNARQTLTLYRIYWIYIGYCDQC